MSELRRRGGRCVGHSARGRGCDHIVTKPTSNAASIAVASTAVASTVDAPLRAELILAEPKLPVEPFVASTAVASTVNVPLLAELILAGPMLPVEPLQVEPLQGEPLQVEPLPLPLSLPLPLTPAPLPLPLTAIVDQPVLLQAESLKALKDPTTCILQ